MCVFFAPPHAHVIYIYSRPIVTTCLYIFILYKYIYSILILLLLVLLILIRLIL